jgi:hypothetical protein
MSFKPRPKKTTSRAARHSKKSPEWYTPAEYVEAARLAMGGIDLDPASSRLANKIVKADAYFDEKSDGLSHPWHGRVFLNPPGGIVGAFWEKLVAEYTSGRVTQAVWVGYSLEQLQVLQRFHRTPLDFPMCVPRRRIAFEFPGRPERRSPTHANYICYLPEAAISQGGAWDVRALLRSCKRFEQSFFQFGAVRGP